MEDTGKKFDLEERTTQFGIQAIQFAKCIPKDTVTVPLIRQFVRSSTSIGANYCEADCAESRKDFEHKMSLCKKEAKETRYWLQMLIEVAPELEQEARVLFQEAHELHLICIAIVKKSQNSSL